MNCEVTAVLLAGVVGMASGVWLGKDIGTASSGRPRRSKECKTTNNGRSPKYTRQIIGPARVRGIYDAANSLGTGL